LLRPNDGARLCSSIAGFSPFDPGSNEFTIRHLNASLFPHDRERSISIGANYFRRESRRSSRFPRKMRGQARGIPYDAESHHRESGFCGEGPIPGILLSQSCREYHPGDVDLFVNLSALGRASNMPTVTFVNEKKSVEVPAGANLRSEAIKAGVQLYPFPHNYLNCMGFGACLSCRVMVKKGLENCSSQGIYEKASFLNPLNPLGFFARLGNEKNMRLACQMQVNGDIEVQTQPAVNWHGENYWS